MIHEGNPAPLSADEALARLMEGNARFVRGEPRFSHTSKNVLAGLAHGQHPYATILGCSDSRVPPELLFDAGFGELFIIRVAGNVISPGSWAASSTRARTCIRNSSWCSGTKAAAPCRPRWP
jgi:carbonic anhydrase